MSDLIASGFNPGICESRIEGVLAAKTVKSTNALPPKPVPG
ncbi:hypothetical protein [Lunatibacter salilacus]|nr:hypothetical protein [Lunatibacter salilacus]